MRKKPKHCPFSVIVHDLSMPIHNGEFFDAIVHTAGSHPGNTAIRLKQDNIDAMEHLVEYAEKMEIPRMIYLSSTSVYGDVRTDVIDEGTDIRNPDVYGLSKYFAEKILLESSLHWICLRLPGIFGEGSYRGWLSSVLKLASENKDITIYSPDFSTNCFVFIDDLVRFIDVLMKKRIDKGIFVLGTSEKIMIKNCVEIIRNAVHSKSFVHVDKRKVFPFSLNIEKAIEHGFTSTRPQEFIEQTAKLFYGMRNEDLL